MTTDEAGTLSELLALPTELLCVIGAVSVCVSIPELFTGHCVSALYAGAVAVSMILSAGMIHCVGNTLILSKLPLADIHNHKGENNA